MRKTKRGPFLWNTVYRPTELFFSNLCLCH